MRHNMLHFWSGLAQRAAATFLLEDVICFLFRQTKHQIWDSLLGADGCCVFFPPRWFLVCSRWQGWLPDLQESAEHGQSPTSVWLLQQNWKAYCKSQSEMMRSFCIYCNVKYLTLANVHTASLSFLLHRLSGRRSTRGLHSVRPGHWWCHAPGYLGPGKTSSLSSSLELAETYSICEMPFLNSGTRWRHTCS